MCVCVVCAQVFDELPWGLRMTRLRHHGVDAATTTMAAASHIRVPGLGKVQPLPTRHAPRTRASPARLARDSDGDTCTTTMVRSDGNGSGRLGQGPRQGKGPTLGS